MVFRLCYFVLISRTDRIRGCAAGGYSISFCTSLCGYMLKINDDSVLWLFSGFETHVFQLTLVCLPKTLNHCREETLSLEHLTGECYLKQNMCLYSVKVILMIPACSSIQICTILLGFLFCTKYIYFAWTTFFQSRLVLLSC